jgi:hypothetical protein
MTKMQVVNRASGKAFDAVVGQLKRVHATFDGATKTWTIQAEMIQFAEALPAWGKGIVPVGAAAAAPARPLVWGEDENDNIAYWMQEQGR